MSANAPVGAIAAFETPEALLAAIRAAQAAGYTGMEAYGPFPDREIAKALGHRLGILPYVPLMAALVGAAIQYGAQYWMNVIDYPIDVGGRPLHSWPAFIPSAIIVGTLWAGVASFLVMLVSLGLPRLHHPIFEVAGFERASQDRFFLAIGRDDPRFDAEDTPLFLASLPLRTTEDAAR